MDTTRGERHVFNWKLAKLLGLYHVLGPSTLKICGFNIHPKYLFAVVLTPITVGTFVMSLIGIYYLMNDVVLFSFNVVLVTNVFLFCYKIISVLYYSNKIWKCFEISSSHFLSYQNYDRNIFEYWRRRTFRSFRETSMVFAVYICPYFVWSFSPCIFNNIYITVRQLDGFNDKFRLNIFNIYPVVSSETYNNNFEIFYCTEFIVHFIYMFISLVFDVFLVMMSYAICCQFETVCNGIEVLGQQPHSNDVLSM